MKALALLVGIGALLVIASHLVTRRPMPWRLVGLLEAIAAVLWTLAGELRVALVYGVGAVGMLVDP